MIFVNQSSACQFSSWSGLKGIAKQLIICIYILSFDSYVAWSIWKQIAALCKCKHTGCVSVIICNWYGNSKQWTHQVERIFCALIFPALCYFHCTFLQKFQLLFFFGLCCLNAIEDSLVRFTRLLKFHMWDERKQMLKTQDFSLWGGKINGWCDFSPTLNGTH